MFVDRSGACTPIQGVYFPGKESVPRSEGVVPRTCAAILVATMSVSSWLGP